MARALRRSRSFWESMPITARTGLFGPVTSRSARSPALLGSGRSVVNRTRRVLGSLALISPNCKAGVTPRDTPAPVDAKNSKPKATRESQGQVDDRHAPQPTTTADRQTPTVQRRHAEPGNANPNSAQ